MKRLKLMFPFLLGGLLFLAACSSEWALEPKLVVASDDLVVFEGNAPQEIWVDVQENDICPSVCVVSSNEESGIQIRAADNLVTVPYKEDIFSWEFRYMLTAENGDYDYGYVTVINGPANYQPGDAVLLVEVIGYDDSLLAPLITLNYGDGKKLQVSTGQKVSLPPGEFWLDVDEKTIDREVWNFGWSGDVTYDGHGLAGREEAKIAQLRLAQKPIETPDPVCPEPISHDFNIDFSVDLRGAKMGDGSVISYEIPASEGTYDLYLVAINGENRVKVSAVITNGVEDLAPVEFAFTPHLEGMVEGDSQVKLKDRPSVIAFSLGEYAGPITLCELWGRDP